jgi:hypothetical protein
MIGFKMILDKKNPRIFISSLKAKRGFFPGTSQTVSVNLSIKSRDF